jgi:hypothetical protein
MSLTLRSVTMLGMFVSIAAVPTANAGPVVTNRCAAEGAVAYLTMVERGGSCEGCLVALAAPSRGGQFLQKVALGERAKLAATRMDSPRVFAWVVGRYRDGVEVPRDGELELAPGADGVCRLNAVLGSPSSDRLARSAAASEPVR